MDPNQALRDLRAMASRIIWEVENDVQAGSRHRGLRLAELTIALDEWLSGGGFLPSDWNMST